VTHRPSSLFRRLILMVGGLLGVGAIALAYAALTYAQVAADDAYDRLLVGATLQIAESVTVVPGRIAVDPPVSAFETLALAVDDRIFYKVTGPGGQVLTGNNDLAAPLREARREGLILADGTYRGFEIRIASITREVTGPGVSGSVTVTVAQTRGARQELTLSLATKSIQLIAVMTALALGAVVLAVRLALRPLDTVRAALVARDPRDVSAVDVAAPREISGLIDAINHVLGRLSERMRGMERFVADAAHQIRTPLTALTAQAGLLANEGDAEKRRYRIGRIQMRTEQLGRLTNQLLSHAMVMHRREVVAPEPIALTPLIRKVLNEAVPHSLERDLEVTFDACEPDLIICGDRVSVSEALINVVSNAVRHGAPSRLVVTLQRRDDHAVIVISDDGPGIPPTEWARALEPFVRLSETHGGSGLGLAITKDVVIAHGGSIGFSERLDQDFEVRIILPTMSAEAGKHP
jgi:two-component system, OmpR family, sensor histidine kinase TctE